MKNAILYFFLFICSCETAILETDLATDNLTERTEGSTFTQYRGYVDLKNQDFDIRIGATNDKDIDSLVSVSWKLGESITFESKVLEFEDDESEIHGTGKCEVYGVLSEGLKVASGTYSLTFQPASSFWGCLELEDCEGRDEVFAFDIFVRPAN